MARQLRLRLFTALVAGVFTQLPEPGTALFRIAYAVPASGDAVIAWNAHAGEAAMKACIAPLDDPFHESRMYAMMHIAIHDALNAIDRRFQPFERTATLDQQTADALVGTPEVGQGSSLPPKGARAGSMTNSCESAPKRDPRQNSSKSLKSSAKTLEVGVPIGADRDPTRNKISFNVSRS
jgi:hypothetical protein